MDLYNSLWDVRGLHLREVSWADEWGRTFKTMHRGFCGRDGVLPASSGLVYVLLCSSRASNYSAPGCFA